MRTPGKYGIELEIGDGNTSNSAGDDFDQRIIDWIAEQFKAENNIDLLFTFGEASVNIAEGAKSKGMKNAFHFNSKEEMTAALRDTLEENDTVIFKASRGMKLEDVIHSVYDRWGK